MSLFADENPTSSSMLVDYQKFADDPAKVTGELTRKQWEDYQNRFVPIENRVMNMTSYNSPWLVTREINQAIGGKVMDLAPGGTGTGSATWDSGYVNRALDASRDSQERSFARYGIAPNAQQRQALDRQSALTQSTAVVDAANRIRQRISERNQSIAQGTIPNAGRSYGLKSEA